MAADNTRDDNLRQAIDKYKTALELMENERIFPDSLILLLIQAINRYKTSYRYETLYRYKTSRLVAIVNSMLSVLTYVLAVIFALILLLYYVASCFNGFILLNLVDFELGTSLSTVLHLITPLYCLCVGVLFSYWIVNEDVVPEKIISALAPIPIEYMAMSDEAEFLFICCNWTYLLFLSFYVVFLLLLFPCSYHH